MVDVGMMERSEEMPTMTTRMMESKKLFQDIWNHYRITKWTQQDQSTPNNPCSNCIVYSNTSIINNNNNNNTTIMRPRPLLPKEVHPFKIYKPPTSTPSHYPTISHHPSTSPPLSHPYFFKRLYPTYTYNES